MKHGLIALFLMLFAMNASGADIELGMPVPDVTLPSMTDDASISLSSFRGKVVYVDFWASWCGPCRQSLPELDALRREYGNDFEVFAVNLDEDPADGLKFLERFPVSYPVVSDAEARWPEVFGVKGMPTSYLLDREGNLRLVHEGYRSGDSEKIESVLKQLIAE